MARVNLLEKNQVAPAFREVYQMSEERSQEVLNVVKLLANCPQMGPAVSYTHLTLPTTPYV